LVVVLVVSATLAQASYYMDETSSNITYLGGSSWNVLNSPLYEVPLYVEKTKLYGGTSTASNCRTVDNCQMTISFQGTGITLYAAVIWAITFSASIDGGPQTLQHFDGVWNCCSSSIQPAYNFAIYDSKALKPGNHNLVITLLDTTQGFTTDPQTTLLFDYAIVYDNISNPTSSIGPTSSDPSTPPSSSSTLGLAVGCAVGGVVLISIVILILLRMRRRTRRQDAVDTIIAANMPEASAYDPHGVAASRYYVRYGTPIPSVHQAPSLKAPASPLTPGATSPTTPVTYLQLFPPTNDSIQPLLLGSESTCLSSASPSTPLTPEEAQFLNSLYHLNIPPTEIAALMNAMRERREPYVGGEAAKVGAAAQLHQPPAYGSRQ